MNLILVINYLTYRNKILTECFYISGKIEKYGTGLSKIRNLVNTYDLLNFDIFPKDYHFVSKFILNPNNLNGGVNGGIKTNIKLLDIIKNNPGIKVRKISFILGKTLRTTERALKKLKDNNKIEFRGSKKTGGYYII